MMTDEEILYEKMIEGIKFLAIGKFDEAIPYFDEILESDNSNLAALNNKAISLNGLKRFDDAIAIFDNILHENPDFIFSLIGKGESLFNLGFYDSAILYFDRALKIDVNNDLALLDKAEVYEKCDQYEEALTCLDRVKWISGYNFIDKTKYDRVLRKFKKETFNQRVAFIKKIQAYVNLNEFEDVYTITNDALNFDNNSLFFLFNNAYSAYMLNKYKKSLSVLDKILKIDFMNLDALDIKSRVLIKLNNYDDALSCFDEIKKFGGFVDSSLYKDISLKANKKTNRLNKFEEYIFKGNDLVLQEDFEGAIECYDSALKINRSSVIALNNKGYVYYLMGDYLQAIGVFNTVFVHDENYAYSLIGKSYSLFYMEYYKDALNCFKKAIEYDRSLIDEEYIKLLNEKIRSS